MPPMFDPVLLLQMAITAFIMLTMKPAKASSFLSIQTDFKPGKLKSELFTSSDGKTYMLHSGMWIEEQILNR